MGSLEPAAPWEGYEYLGRRTREDILEALPNGWGFEGKAVLDFGCGAGRTLRHFTEEARSCELWGCDIDAASIAWLEEHLCPPLRVFQNAPDPPLPHPDGKFDLIWAVSVFTHLTDTWSRWLLELRRVLADDGLLYVTFMGRGTCEDIAGETWEVDN